METSSVGLCEDCRHTQRVTSAKGSEFRRCLMHDRDPRFAKYPRLPVVRCSGYEKESGDRAR
jgi:hypothetical protein